MVCGVLMRWYAGYMEGMNSFRAERGSVAPERAIVSLADTAGRNRVQIALAKLAYPGDPSPMARWVEEYAARYGTYADSPEHAGETIDVQDEDALRTLLAELPGEETIH